jgi:protease IV
MFSRRHPYLFFLLVFSSIASVAAVAMAMLFAFGSKGFESEAGEKVGIIEINGVILDSKDIVNDIERFREDNDIKSIVIRIDSPGGGVAPSQEIFREIRKTLAVKKVVASMGAMAASGGYYVAAAANGIVANPGTITGSIGVIMGFTNFKALLEKIGLIPVVVKSGEYKDTGSPVRDMTDAERKVLQDLVDTIHAQFVSAVVEGRKMDRSHVEGLADGRIFSGEEGKALGLVDRLGNLADAVEWAGRLGGIEGKISTVYAKESKLSLLRYVLDSTLSGAIQQITHSHLYTGYLYQPQNQ